VSELRESMSIIKIALLGNEYNEDGGLIARQRAAEVMLEEHDSWIIKFKWIGSIVIGLMAAVELLYQCTSAYNAIFPHKK
jgi:hypothetical protein